jgi:hypothetical protein
VVRSGAANVARQARPHHPLARPRTAGAAADDARRARRRASRSRSGPQPPSQPAQPLSALPHDPRSPASSGTAADHLSAPPRIGGFVFRAVRSLQGRVVGSSSPLSPPVRRACLVKTTVCDRHNFPFTARIVSSPHERSAGCAARASTALAAVARAEPRRRRRVGPHRLGLTHHPPQMLRPAISGAGLLV